MEFTELPLPLEHAPPPKNKKKKGPFLRRVLLKVSLFFIVFLSFFNLPNLISTIQDLGPGLKHVIPGLHDEREEKIQEILKVLDDRQTDLASVTKEALAEVIYEESRRYNHDPKIILALIETESSFRNWSVSDKGAKGLMQIMPNVAESLAQQLGIEWMGDRTLFNPYLNIRMGIFYLSQLLVDFGDQALALTAYNYGPTYVRGLLDRKEHVPLNFYQRILAAYHNLQGEKPSLTVAENSDAL